MTFQMYASKPFGDQDVKTATIHAWYTQILLNPLTPSVAS